MITIHLNGEVREIPEGLALTALLEWLKLAADRVAVERNLEIVPRDRWLQTLVQAGDRLEVVHFVGGGSFSSREPDPRPRRLGLACPPRFLIDAQLVGVAVTRVEVPFYGLEQ